MIPEGIKFNELVSLHLFTINELHELKMKIQEAYISTFPDKIWALTPEQRIYALQMKIKNLSDEIANAK